MKLTKSELRQIIKEELGRITESVDKVARKVEKGVQSVLGRGAESLDIIGDGDTQTFGLGEADNHIFVTFEDGKYYIGIMSLDYDYIVDPYEVNPNRIDSEVAKLAKRHKRQLT